MTSMHTNDIANRRAIRDRIAAQMAEYVATHGEPVTQPLVVRDVGKTIPAHPSFALMDIENIGSWPVRKSQ